VDTTAWERVERLRGWLDTEATAASAGDVRLLRVLKISKEVGEVAELCTAPSAPTRGREPQRQDSASRWPNARPCMRHTPIPIMCMPKSNIRNNGKDAMGKRLKAVLATAGLLAGAGLGVVGTASPAAADQCRNTRNVYIPGGESHYTITCDKDGHVVVDGWLKDTRNDGKCVRVKAQIYSVWYYSNKACPKGEVEYFHWRSTKPTKYANVWTYTVG
jgi:hypothetical protein